ncbi:hypothetical protein GQ464_011545 [Rhodocaloribacter litoris]|uniref:hypothetical protein n=1 Tax=Rhodocaloribacter litoris TaxID=2558931 RepID=UPI00141EF2B4|nr:hypothetical protein [Rhodocaloribacter litoris]QXD14092.1 hypothetical protein GQ464_011545 [Rhodocaloribacter litoris]
MGGFLVGDARDATALFADPAALGRLAGPEIRLGGGFTATHREQRQRWIPNRVYAELSLLFENDPEAVHPTRAFDTIRPDWAYDRSAVRPVLGAVALPLPGRVAGFTFTAGLGFAQVASLDHYYQNNNALDPNIGQLRPAPIPRVQDGDSLLVDWFQFSREREGALYGITPALAARRGPFLLGVAVTILTGTSDDREHRLGRGLLTLRYNNDFSLVPSPIGEEITTGSSDYSGVRAVLSGRLDMDQFAVGIALRPGFTLKRTWTQAGARSGSGTDELRMPTQVTFGFALYPSARWRLVAGYDLRRTGAAEYVPEGGSPFSPWVDGSALHLGAEFQAREGLALRGGYHSEPRGFAPAGAAFLDDPAKASVYAAGLGLSLGRIGLDLTYEFSRLRYEDLWISNENDNRRTTHTVLFETSYRF